MGQERIDKTSKTPLHAQIYSDLLSKIERGIYQVNDKMPSEPELQEMYDVSRITIRSAMQELEQKGHVKKYRGIGTIVCEPKQKLNLQQLTSFSADMGGLGGRPGAILLTFEEVIPDKKIASALQSAADETVYYIERKRLRENKIIGLHRAYIRKVDGLQLKKADFAEDTSLYELLKERGVHLKHAVELLEAQMPSSELCRTIDISRNQPVFYKERTTYDDKNVPVEYVEIFYRADFYQYKVSMNLNQ